MSDRRAFLDAIAAAPEDDAPQLVFADWLDERGDAAAAELLRLRVERRRLFGSGLGVKDRNDRYTEIDKRIWELNSLLTPVSAVTEPESYDWRHAFSYASGGEYGAVTIRRAAPHIEVSEAPFGRLDVVEIIALRVGKNDGPNWVCVGRLADGRWFALDAGCDYTGWD